MRALQILFLICASNIFGQSNIWTSFYSYDQITGVRYGKDSKVYAASNNSLFSYDPSSNEVSKITTINGLLGDQISTFSVTNKLIIVGYQNGVFGIHDILDGSVVIDNSIKRNLSINPINKTINSFLIIDHVLYICADYGISTYDLNRNLFLETYYFGSNNSEIKVNEIALVGESVYAATEDGLFKAFINDPNLVLESAWNRISEGEWKSIGLINNTILGIVQFGEQSIFYELISDSPFEHFRENGKALWTDIGEKELVVSFSEKILSFNNTESVSTIAYKSGVLEEEVFSAATSIGDKVFVGTLEGGLLYQNGSEIRKVSPSGPLMNNIFEISVISDDELWIAHGAFNKFYNPYPLNSYGLSNKSGSHWKNIPYDNLLGAQSIVSVVPNPNNQSQVFACSMHNGILEINDGIVQNLWDFSNSGLESLDPIELGQNPNYRSVRVRDVGFDSQGSMWSISSYLANGLKKLTPEGLWKNIDLTPILSSVNSASGYSNLVISSNDEIFFGSSNSGLIGYAKINGSTLLRSLDVANNLPTNDVRSIALDADNNLWIGTVKGLRVLYDASRLFVQSDIIARTLTLEDEGNVGELLANQYISAIQVDGNNQKWVATDGAGIFLFSVDGKKTLHHFTKDNSPLPSNSITSLAYNPKSGKVYMGTPNGLVAFQGNAYGSANSLEEIKIFPNPIRPGYTSLLTIRGLKADCIVKITDIMGNAVFEFKANGGSFSWDLRSFSGERVRSGVYLIFVTTKDGKKSAVEKVMIIN